MEKLDKLREYISRFDKLCVASSGGVDSDLVMNVAYEVLKDNAIAIIGDGIMLSRKDLNDAERLAKKAGIKYYIIKADAFAVKEFKFNDRKRCYYCKKNIMGGVIQKARNWASIPLPTARMPMTERYTDPALWLPMSLV